MTVSYDLNYAPKRDNWVIVYGHVIPNLYEIETLMVSSIECKIRYFEEFYYYYY